MLEVNVRDNTITFSPEKSVDRSSPKKEIRIKT